MDDKELRLRLEKIEGMTREIHQALFPSPEVMSIEEIIDSYGSDIRGASKALRERSELLKEKQ